jgi:hypothetical protein
MNAAAQTRPAQSRDNIRLRDTHELDAGQREDAREHEPEELLRDRERTSRPSKTPGIEPTSN